MDAHSGRERKKNTARCAVFPLGWWVLGQGAPQEAEQSQRCCFPTGAFLQCAAGIWLKKKKNVLWSTPPRITGVQHHGAEALASAQTPLPLTAAFWQQKSLH